MNDNGLAIGVRLLGEGKVDDAIASFEKVLSNEQDPIRRAHILAQLADGYRMGERHEDAIRTAQDAFGLAKRTADTSAEAHACFSLGTALLARWDHNESRELFMQALEQLDRSVTLYKELGKIEFSSAQLTLAEALFRIDEFESAEHMYTSVIHELANPRWATSGETAGYANYVQGRAFSGIGFVRARSGETAKAAFYFEKAINFLFESNQFVATRDVEDIAKAFDTDLDEPEVATHIRAEAARRFGTD